jgi:hypothetical protein
MLAAVGIGPSLVRTSAPESGGAATEVESQPSRAEKDEYEHSAAYLLEDFLDTAPGQVPEHKPWSEPETSMSGDEAGSSPAPHRLALRTHPTRHQRGGDRIGCVPKSRGERTGAIRRVRAASAPLAGNQQSRIPETRHDHEIGFLVATVPEPLSPALRYEFDAEIGAIQTAAARAGYWLADFDIPWKATFKDHEGEFRFGRPIKLSFGNDETTSARLKPDTDDETRADRDPGILLFDLETSSIKKLLIVFIVGETPTRGVNKLVLRDALDQIAWIRGWRKRKPRLGYLTDVANPLDEPYEIRIVGPAFSGSAASMRNTLDEWFDSFQPDDSGPSGVKITSGAATSISGQLELQNRPIQFSTVRVPDPLIWRFLLRDLETGIGRIDPNEGYADYDTYKTDYKVAILFDETAFGSGAAIQARHYLTDPFKVLTTAFPLHISDLRTAYSKVNPAQVATGPQVNARDLPMPDESGQRGDDVVPPFSTRSAEYDELVLAKILTTLKREHIRLVGVIATDVEDLVFLAQRIRDYCPDTTIFTTSTDLRFLHSQVSRDLDGMLIFSTYPLFSEDQNWNPYTTDNNRVQFPSEDAEGVFNATLWQLGDQEDMVEYGEPFAGPVEKTSPVLWVSVVGQHDIWPFAYQRIPPEWLDSHMVQLPHANNAFHAVDFARSLYPRPFQIGFFLLSVVALGSFAFIGLENGGPPAPLLGSPFANARLFLRRWTTGRQRAFERHVVLSAAAVAVLTAYTIGLGFVSFPFRLAATNPSVAGMGRTADCYEVASILVWVLVFCSALIAVYRVIRNWQRGGLPWGILLFLVACIGEFILAAFFLHSRYTFSWTMALLSFLRASHLWSGVSPLTPLIFVAIAGSVLICCLLHEMVLTEECHTTRAFWVSTPWGRLPE